MKPRGNGIGGAGGPTVSDVARLWMTIQHDLVSDAFIKIRPAIHESVGARLHVQVVSVRFDDDHAEGYPHVWASKSFTDNGYYITWGQLFELLILAYREMERVLSEDNPPPA